MALLLEHPCRMRERDIHGYGPLGVAAFANRPEIVTAILAIDGGAAIGKEMKYAPLAVAAAMGHESILQLLIERGEKPNKFSQTFRGTAFHAALMFGELSCAHYLWSLNHHIIDRDKTSPTALELAFEMNRIDCARWALPKYRQRIDSDISLLKNLVRATVRGGSVDILSWMLTSEENFETKFYDIFQKLYSESSAIREACINGTPEFLRWLITDGGCSSNAEFQLFDDAPLLAPVVQCFELKRIECLEVLFKYSRELDIRRVTRKHEGRPESLLFRACMDGDEALIGALIRLGADVEEKVYMDSCGNHGARLTAVFASLGKTHVVRLLVEQGGAQLSKRSSISVLRKIVERFGDKANRYADSRIYEKESVSEASALYASCYFGHLETSEWIFKSMRCSDTIYKVACNELLFMFFSRGAMNLASALVKMLPRLIEGKCSSAGKTLLDLAIEGGKLTIAKSLVAGLNGISLSLNRHLSDTSLMKISAMSDGAQSVAIVRWLAQNGKKFDVCDMTGLVGIDFFGSACLHGNLELIKYLVLEVGGCWREKVNQSFENVKPISWACAGGQVPVVQFLYEQGASLFERDTSYNTTMHLAAGKGKNLELIDFIARTLSSDPASLKNMLESRNWLGRTPILEAAAPGNARKGGGSLKIIQSLLALGAELEVADKSRNTLVHLGAMSGDIVLLQFCLDRGLKFEHESYVSPGPPHGPIWNCAMHGRTEALDFILDVALPQSTGLSESSFRAEMSNIVCLFRLGIYGSEQSLRAPFIRHLIENRGYGQKIALSDVNLHYECCGCYGRVEALKVLVELTPITFDWSDDSCYANTIGIACENGDLDTLKYLFSLGAPKALKFGPNLIDPLMAACSGCHLPLVKYLLSQGASPFETDATGRTAFDYAQEWFGEDVHTFLADLLP